MKMKKTMIAAVAALAMSGAMAAEYVTFGAGGFNDANTGAKNIVGSVAVGASLDGYLGGLTGELRALVTRDNELDQVGNAAEARATYALPTVWGAKTWVRGTLGESYGSGYNYGYWAVEPGFTYVFNPVVSAEASVSRELTFARTAGSDATTYNVGVNYALSKTNVVTGKAYRTQTGDNFFNGYTAELRHGF
jgi:hypothetical protein